MTSKAENVTQLPGTTPGLALLRAPFPENQISKLPKETKAQIDARKADKNQMVFNCATCGGHHHKNAVHLDYVGHAALTDRLLDTDPAWFWEPAALTADGLPAFDSNRGLWIKLTVLGVTRLGYGSADGKTGGDAIKEIIGDALRNAAMRFGAALDLWHKGDLHADEGEDATDTAPKAEGMPDAEWAKLAGLIKATASNIDEMTKYFGVANLRLLNQDQYAEALEMLNKKLAKLAKAQSDAKAREPEPPPKPARSEFAEILDDDIPF
jgi:hypothetical protein